MRRQQRDRGPETMVRTYKKAKDYQKDAQKLGKQGWRVVGTVEHRPRSGLGRITTGVLTLGIGALMFPPKPEIVVTYERER